MRNIHPLVLGFTAILILFMIAVMCVFSAAIEVESKYATMTQQSIHTTETYGAEQFHLQLTAQAPQ